MTPKLPNESQSLISSDRFKNAKVELLDTYGGDIDLVCTIAEKAILEIKWK